MRFAGANEETLGLATNYFKIISWALCPPASTSTSASSLRGLGKLRVTMFTICWPT